MKFQTIFLVLMLFSMFQVNRAAFADEDVDQVEESDENGAYKIGIGLYRPSFTEADNYEDFYGAPGLGGTILIEHFPWEFAVTLGYSFRLSYYQDSGHAATVVDDSITKDRTSPSDLSLIPVQASLNLLATPFPDSKWFTVSGWIGFERVIFNETRRDQGSDSDDEDNKVFSNFAYKNNSVVGGSLNILIQGKRSSSGIDVLGMRRIFISPYLEIVTALDDDKLKLGGNRLGLAFSFELDAG